MVTNTFRKCPVCGAFMSIEIVKDMVSWHKEWRCPCGCKIVKDVDGQEQIKVTDRTEQD